MNRPCLPEPRSASSRSASPRVFPRRNTVEDRDWHASSRDLAEGLVVEEIVETLPAELLPFL